MEGNIIRRVCVVGAGTMGSQIAQQVALSDYPVTLTDTDGSQLERAVSNNVGHLERRVQKGRLERQEMETALRLVRTETDLAVAVSDADFVVEAIIEDLDAKRALFAVLDRLAPQHTIFASNSSTIGISQIVEDSIRPDRCVNMHFFHPALVMRLVEVMRGPRTSEHTVSATCRFAEAIGKEVVVVQREIYGLLVNRILGAIKREAFFLAGEGYATPEDIDRAVKLGLNHPMGPFELSDFSGLDIYYHAALQRYRESGDEGDRPPRILEEKVKAGHLGRKSGKGFYEYPE